jgi:NAD(P)-dependent dehydrogenase (short-subunit alcohol dehydrogenase family)
MAQFKNKVAIVTGGASGIGRALCELLGQRGAIVIVADIHLAEAKQVALSIRKAGGEAGALWLDVSQAQAVQRVIEETVSEYGLLDLMFNNAGIAVSGDMRESSLEEWQKIINVNLLGVVYGTTAAYSVMIEQGFGHIVNTASLAGLVSAPMLTAYSTTKHAVVGLSTSLRAEAADLGVQVSVICPSFVQTPMLEQSAITDHGWAKGLKSKMLGVISAQKAAQKILKGVERNRAFIIFPFQARFAWWFYRLYPNVSNSLLIREFRKE